jgi:DNA polymerase I-like protein with 3'-5' exonuclease and polymerase domains
VHDELVYEITDSELANLTPHIKDVMESVLPTNATLGVPIVIDVKAGPSWGDMHKL